MAAIHTSGSSSLVSAVIAIAVALLAASLIAVVIKSRAGTLRDVSAVTDQVQALPGIELSATGPTIVHFSAAWCGPCAAVRRVVNEVAADYPQLAHREVDIDANPDAARALSVLSLPTTFIFDASGQLAHRVSGVPKATDLRTALQSMAQPG